MARNNSQHSNNSQSKDSQHTNYIDDAPHVEESSSHDIDIHQPSKDDKNLEVDPLAYILLEYINLDWPAQSIALHKSKIYFGTNPDLLSKSNKAEINLISVDCKETDYINLKFNKKRINRFLNKIIFNNNLFGISDNHLSSFDKALNLIREVNGEFSYGLFINDNLIFAGTKVGHVQIYDHDLNLINILKIHNAPIETISVENSIIYTGSSDHTLKFTTSSGQIINTIENDSDINCLDIKNGNLIYGDDNGIIHLLNIQSGETEIINWHKSAISTLKWKDNEVFASGSDEQLCLWDISLEEDWEFSKYLLFVHQGQTYYKDVCFEDDRVITTSQDGICIFTPVSFSIE